MKIKILILILVMFMISGCTAEVNLEISVDTIKESVDITAYQDAIYSKDILKTSFRDYIPIYASVVIVDAEDDLPVSSVLYYDKTETDLGNGYLFNYSYDFPIEDYSNARTIKNAFKSYDISVNNSDNTLLLSTDSEGILYFDDYEVLDEVTINITTDYVVLENNADKVEDGVYTWVFTRDSEKSINILIDIEKSISEREADNTKNMTIISTILGIIVIILLFLFIKTRKNNKLK